MMSHCPQGADLSGDPYLPITTDIDGDKREGDFSIGADEGTPTKIYRSVGPSNTTALATGQGNDLTISGSTATFDESLPNRIGVGDAIQYDDDGDGDIDSNDSIVFIHGRTSSIEYTVKTSTGGTPTAVTNDNDWSIFRAYTALALAETGTENTGIDADLVDFDTFTAGRDLIANGEQWNIACYGDSPDSTYSRIDDWTTSDENYLKIYTPVYKSEVGESQRHQGKWDGSKYNISISGDDGIEVRQSGVVRIEGLQLSIHATGWQNLGIIAQTQTTSTDVYIANNIIKGSHEGAQDYHSAIEMNNANVRSHIWNNIIYGFNSGGDDNNGIWLRYNESYVFNNTVYDCDTGFSRSAPGIVYAKNNIAQDCTDGFYDVPSTNADFNISDLAGDAPGSHSKNSTNVSFRNESNDDLGLAMSDTSAQRSGPQSLQG